MPPDQSGVDGRVAIGVARVDLSRCGDQNFDGLQVPVPASKVQWRVVVRQQAFIDDRTVGFDICQTARNGGEEEKGARDVFSCERGGQFTKKIKLGHTSVEADMLLCRNNHTLYVLVLVYSR